MQKEPLMDEVAVLFCLRHCASSLCLSLGLMPLKLRSRWKRDWQLMQHSMNTSDKQLTLHEAIFKTASGDETVTKFCMKLQATGSLIASMHDRFRFFNDFNLAIFLK